MKSKNVYNRKEWLEFSYKVLARDNFQCVKCGRTKKNTTLQVHHKIYKRGAEVWESPMSDCITLCNSCHAKEHDLIEPTEGWSLISIDDLGDLSGICEKKGCGNSIRYEHLIYHPNWGYKIVGSTCVEYLTEEDQNTSKQVLKIINNIQKFINESSWETGFTKKNAQYLSTTYKHHIIRIYGEKRNFSYQIGLKVNGERKHEFEKCRSVSNKSLHQVKELAYIVLKGKLSEDEKQKNILRDLYIKAI